MMRGALLGVAARRRRDIRFVTLSDILGFPANLVIFKGAGSFPSAMYIRKQRLLTPGPTPLLPQALHAMMGSDIHHRTEDFRKLYRQVLADLKEVMGTQNDVLALVASGTGAMEASVANLFSAGDKVIVCSAGKFGERWAEITKAFGLDVVLLQSEYGDAVSPDRVEKALAENPTVRGVFVQASETSTGASHDV